MTIYRGWAVVFGAFCVATAAWGLGFYGPAVYLAALTSARGWSIATVSSAITVYYLAGAFLLVFVGGAMERFGARLVALVCSLVMAASVLALTIVWQPWQVYIAFVVMAFGWAGMSAAAVTAMIAPWFDRRRGLAVSLALNGASFGGILVAPYLVAMLAAFGFDDGMRLGVAGVMAVLVPVILLTLFRRERYAHERDPKEADSEPVVPGAPSQPIALRILLGQRGFLSIVGSFCIGYAVQVGFLIHLITYLSPRVGEIAAGWCIVAISIAAVVGRVGTGFVIDSIDRRGAACANFAVQIAALVLLQTVDGEWLIYVACVMFGLGVGNMVTLPGLIIQVEFPAPQFTRIVSLVMAITQVSYALAPGALGIIRDWTGDYGAVLVLCTALHAIAALVIMIRSRKAPAISA